MATSGPGDQSAISPTSYVFARSPSVEIAFGRLANFSLWNRSFLFMLLPLLRPCGHLWVLLDLRAQQRLNRAALVHRAVALRHLVERQGQVEHLAGVDLPLPHQVD